MKPCNSYISRASIKLTRLFFPQAKIYLASRLPFLQVFTNQELLTPFSLYSLHLHLELSHMLKTFSILCYFPSPNLDRVFFPRKNKKAKERSLSLSILAFYNRTPAPPTSTFLFPSFIYGNCPHQP